MKNAPANVIQTIQPGGRVFATVAVIERQGDKAVLKDFSHCSWFFRSTFGVFLIGHETRAYRRLQGVPGVPRLIDRPCRQALLLEYVAGINCLASPPRGFSQDFFDQALLLLSEVRSRGVLHLDVAGNLILGADGRPWLVDFGSCVVVPKWFGARYLSDLRRKYDERALLKLKRRRAPQLLRPAEAERSRAILPFETWVRIAEKLLKRTIARISG